MCKLETSGVQAFDCIEGGAEEIDFYSFGHKFG